jgi:hypothetical protein
MPNEEFPPGTVLRNQNTFSAYLYADLEITGGSEKRLYYVRTNGRRPGERGSLTVHAARQCELLYKPAKEELE